MENEYSKIYNYFFNKTIKSVETIFKTLLIKNREQGRNFNNLHNKNIPLIYNLSSTKKLYIKTSNKFNDLVKTYNNRCSYYEDQFTNSIFINELYEIFTSIKDIRKGYNYKKCIAELGQINGLYEAHRRLRKFYHITDILYKLNDFSEFELWNDNTGIEGSEFYEKYRNKLYPTNKPNIISKTLATNKKKIIIKNFNLKKEYSYFTNKYNYFIANYIDSEKTKMADFKDIFTKDWNENLNILKFTCTTQEMTLVLTKLSFFFNNLDQTNIIKSKKFQTKSGKLITQSNFSKSYKSFYNYYEFIATDPKTDVKINKILNLEQIKALNRIDNLISEIKSNKILIK